MACFHRVLENGWCPRGRALPVTRLRYPRRDTRRATREISFDGVSGPLNALHVTRLTVCVSSCCEMTLSDSFLAPRSLASWLRDMSVAANILGIIILVSPGCLYSRVSKRIYRGELNLGYRQARTFCDKSNRPFRTGNALGISSSISNHAPSVNTLISRRKVNLSRGLHEIESQYTLSTQGKHHVSYLSWYNPVRHHLSRDASSLELHQRSFNHNPSGMLTG